MDYFEGKSEMTWPTLFIVIVVTIFQETVL